jgi:rod shape-determining protein MreB
VAIRPLREGVISDYDMTERMLKEFIRKVSPFSMVKPRIVICVPSGITEVEERAVIDAGIQAGARRVYLIEEPVAAAIGAGIDISKPDGHMVVDIGGGTADIAVISLSGVVESASIKVAGDQFNEAVVKYIRRKHNVLIGERTAEDLKISIGCVFPRPEEVTMEIKGRCLMTGLPRVFSVNSSEMIEAFEEPSQRILEAIHSVLERTPPELVADISTNGIVMTGGGSLVWGFDKLIESHTGIETHVADDAISCVAYGCGKSLDMLGDMQDGTMNLSRRRQMN